MKKIVVNYIHKQLQNPPNVTSRVKSIAVFTPHLPFLVSNEKTLVSHIQQTVKVRAQDSKTISYNTYFYQDMITPLITGYRIESLSQQVYPNKSLRTASWTAYVGEYGNCSNIHKEEDKQIVFFQNSSICILQWPW